MKAENKYSNLLLKLTDIKILYYIVPALLIGAYLFRLVSVDAVRGAEGYYMIHYLYTYNHGFVAGGFVGEVLSRFFDTISFDLTQKVVIAGDIMLALSAALCIGRSLSLSRDNKIHQIFVFALLLIISASPFAFRAYFVDIKLDTFVWAVALLAVFLSDFKIGVWFVPALCIIATLINPVFLFTSMILVSIILLQKFHDSGMSKSNGIICGVAFIGMIALGIYGAIMEKKLGFETPREMVDYYFSRYYTALDEQTIKNYCELWLYDYFESVPAIIKNSFNIYLAEYTPKAIILNFLLFVIPIYILFVAVWKRAIKNTEDKFQKLIFLLCMVSPVVCIIPIILSWETSKYFQNNFIVQAGLIIWYVCHKNTAVTKALHDLYEKCAANPIITACVVMYLALFEF